MTDKSLPPSEAALLDTIDTIFYGGEFSPQPVVPGMVYRKLRVADAIDPIRGQSWRAVEQKAAYLANGRYVPKHELTYRRLGADILNVHLDISEFYLWASDIHDRELEQIKPDVEHGWSVLKFFGEPVELGWGQDPWSVK